MTHKLRKLSLRGCASFIRPRQRFATHPPPPPPAVPLLPPFPTGLSCLLGSRTIYSPNWTVLPQFWTHEQSIVPTGLSSLWIHEQSIVPNGLSSLWVHEQSIVPTGLSSLWIHEQSIVPNVLSCLLDSRTIYSPNWTVLPSGLTNNL